MAVDKLVDSTQLDADLTSVANAIRTKGGTSASLAFPSGFVSAIGAISGGSDILILPGADSTVTVSSGVRPAWYLQGYNNRRCLLKTSGDHSIRIAYTTSSTRAFSGLYPLPIPSGSTKVSISATGPKQCIYMTYAWDGSDYTKVDDSGWVNLPITNGAVSSTAGWIGISFRVNSSSSDFNASNQPTNVSVTFE